MLSVLQLLADDLTCQWYFSQPESQDDVIVISVEKSGENV